MACDIIVVISYYQKYICSKYQTIVAYTVKDHCIRLHI